LPKSSKSSKKAEIAWAERRAHTRERLIAGAREAIAEKGFHRTTLDEIAARAGLTKGAIYDNFESKEQLFLAVVARWAAERHERFAWPKGHAGSLRQRLRLLAQAVIADAPEAQAEAPMRAEFLLYTLTHEEMRTRVAEAGIARHALLREQVLQFVKEEELPLPLDRFVVMLDALVPGLIFVRSQAPKLVPDEAILEIFESLAGALTSV
jgi:AcrR family transcriptional regulator